MEASSTRLGELLVKLDFSPLLGFEIEVPGVVQVTYSLSSEDYEVGVFQLRNMICSLPWSSLIFLRTDLYPGLSCPVKDADAVEPLLVGPTPSENNDLMIL